jgi:hypothetical protein
MAAQAPRLVKIERITHREGVNRLRKAYYRLWRFSVECAECEARKPSQEPGCVQKHRAVQEGQP